MDSITYRFPEHEAPSTLSMAPIVQGETIQKSNQEQTHKEEESTAIDKDRSCTPENELEQTTEVLEAIDLPETKGKVGAENEEHADHLSEAPSMENVTTKNIDSEEMVTMECSTKSSYDVKELEKIPESPSVENREMKDDGKTTSEEAIGLPEYETLSTLPTIASVEVATVEKGSQEEIHKEAKSAVIETEEGQRQENDFEETKKVPEAFDFHEAKASTSTENEKKAEPQSEAQSLENMVIKHPNFERLGTTEINTSNDTEELENIPVCHTGEKLENKDGGKIIQEEAKEMEQATYMQLPKTVTESVPEHEAPSTLPTSEIVQDETIEKMIQEKTHKEEESTAIDNEQNSSSKNELKQTTKVLEHMLKQAIDLPKTMGKVGAENEEHAEHQILTMESRTKSSCDVEKLENILDSQSVENSEIKNGGKFTPEEAIDIKEGTDVELQKSETESVLEDKAISTLPTIASVRVDTVEKIIQEDLQKEAESAVTDTNNKQRPENDFEEKKKVPEAFDLHDATGNTSAENEKKVELQSEVQSLETMDIKHPNLEGLETTEINPCKDTEELEKFPASHTEEKLEIKDGRNIIQEEAKETEQAADMQLPKTATESLPEDKARSTLPTSAIVKGRTVEKSFQEQTLKEEESTAIDNDKSSRPQNEFEQTTEVLEEIDLPKTMEKISAGNEEQADHQSEAPSIENVITKHSNSEGMMIAESSTKSSYDVEELENIPESHSIENSKIKDGGKITSEETINIKEATDVELQKSETESVPEDKDMSTLATLASVRVESVEKSIQEEIHKEAESAVTDTEEGQRQQNDFEEKKKVLEASDLHEVTGNTCTENEKKSDPQSEAQSLEAMVKKQLNLEGLETTEIGPSNDTEEHEKIPLSHTGQKFEIKDRGKIILEEEKEMEEAIDMQSLKYATESVPEDEAPSTSPTSEFVKGETVEKRFQEQALNQTCVNDCIQQLICVMTGVSEDKSLSTCPTIESTCAVLSLWASMAGSFWILIIHSAFE